MRVECIDILTPLGHAGPSAAQQDHTMMRCKPKGVCSWDFFIDGDNHNASLEFKWMGEQGSIIVDGILYEVRKHGVFSGNWTLIRAGTEVVSAQKSTALTRTFKIQDGSNSLVLRAESAFGRSFRIERFGDIIATVCPDHAFTRRATIKTFGAKWDFTIIAFAFWLIVLMWRRAANSGAAAGAAG